MKEKEKFKLGYKPEYLKLYPIDEDSLEYKALEEDIKETRKLRKPIIVNKEGYILSGQRRFHICNTHKIDPCYVVFDVSPEEELMLVLKENEQGRPQSDYCKALLGLEYLKTEKVKAEARMKAGKNPTTFSMEGQKPVPYEDHTYKDTVKGEAMQITAEKIGWTFWKFQQVKTILEGPEEIIEIFKTGKYKTNKVYEVVASLKQMDAEQKKATIEMVTEKPELIEDYREKIVRPTEGIMDFIAAESEEVQKELLKKYKHYFYTEEIAVLEKHVKDLLYEAEDLAGDGHQNIGERLVSVKDVMGRELPNWVMEKITTQLEEKKYLDSPVIIKWFNDRGGSFVGYEFKIRGRVDPVKMKKIREEARTEKKKKKLREKIEG